MRLRYSSLNRVVYLLMAVMTTTISVAVKDETSTSLINDTKKANTAADQNNAAVSLQNASKLWTTTKMMRIETTAQALVTAKNAAGEPQQRYLRTADINAAWIGTFHAFFGIELALISLFIAFGCISFAFMQRRPDGPPEHELLSGPWFQKCRFGKVPTVVTDEKPSRNSLRPYA